MRKRSISRLIMPSVALLALSACSKGKTGATDITPVDLNPSYAGDETVEIIDVTKLPTATPTPTPGPEPEHERVDISLPV